jgi:hypothetical protein
VIYGGKLSDGRFSDELWFYNVTERTWSLRAISSAVRPPRLTRHTLTLSGGDEGWLYLFGGSTVGGEFSSKLFRIKLSLGKTASCSLCISLETNSHTFYIQSVPEFTRTDLNMQICEILIQKCSIMKFLQTHNFRGKYD